MNTNAARNMMILRKICYTAVTGIFLFTISCKNADREQKGDKKEFSQGVQHVNKELNKVTVMEQDKLKDKIDSVIADFNVQINEFESELNEGNRRMDANTEELLNDLKADRDTLKMKLNVIENQSEKQWKVYKKELEHDVDQFTMNVKDFFQNNQ